MRLAIRCILILFIAVSSVRAQKAPAPDGGSVSALPKDLKKGGKVPLLVFLHGKRNSPDDVFALLKPLVEPWRCAVLAPRGSVAMGPRPDGTPGYGWKPETDVEVIGGEIRRMIEAGSVDAKRVYLAGFSAGAHLCYAVLAKHPEIFAGTICFGGAIQKTLVAEEDLKAAVRTPVFIVHGQRDRVIPPRLGEQARDVLAKAGFRVRLKTFPGDHQMPTDYLDVLKEAVEWCDAQKAELDAKPPAEAGRKETP